MKLPSSRQSSDYEDSAFPRTGHHHLQQMEQGNFMTQTLPPTEHSWAQKSAKGLLNGRLSS